MIVPDRQRVTLKGNINERNLPTRDGKISVSMSLKGCKQCEKLTNEIAAMRKEIARLNNELEI